MTELVAAYEQVLDALALNLEALGVPPFDAGQRNTVRTCWSVATNNLAALEAAASPFPERQTLIDAFREHVEWFARMMEE